MIIKKENTRISIVFLCYDETGRFLLGKRSKDCKDEPGKWDVGATDFNIRESPIETLAKGVRDEFCYRLLKDDFLGQRSFYKMIGDTKTCLIGLDFKVLIGKIMERELELNKFEAIGFFSLDNLPPKKQLYSQLPIFLEKYKDRLR